MRNSISPLPADGEVRDDEVRELGDGGHPLHRGHLSVAVVVEDPLLDEEVPLARALDHSLLHAQHDVAFRPPPETGIESCSELLILRHVFDC